MSDANVRKTQGAPIRTGSTPLVNDELRAELFWPRGGSLLDQSAMVTHPPVGRVSFVFTPLWGNPDVVCYVALVHHDGTEVFASHVSEAETKVRASSKVDPTPPTASILLLGDDSVDQIIEFWGLDPQRVFYYKIWMELPGPDAPADPEADSDVAMTTNLATVRFQVWV